MNAIEGSFSADRLSPVQIGAIAVGTFMKPGPDISATEPEGQVRLVLAIADGRDRAAFAALFNHFAPRIKAFVMRAGIAASAAEDVAQETMLTVWKKAGYFDPSKASVSTWVFTIARNLRIDMLRREGRQTSLPNTPDPADMPDEPVTGETAVISAERDERVRLALASLSDEQAQIVRLAYYSETPQTEIAKQLGIPLGTVKSRTRLAMSRLRTLLDETT